jgi:hypothetical protein
MPRPPPLASLGSELSARPAIDLLQACGAPPPLLPASEPCTVEVHPEAHTVATLNARAELERTLLATALEDVAPGLDHAARAPGPGARSTQPFVNQVLRSPAFKVALQQLPRATLVAALEEQVRERRPDASPGQVTSITGRLAGEIELCLRTDTARRLREVAVAQLSQAAAEFRAAADSPVALAAIRDRLVELEAAGADDRSRAPSLREGLGLEGGGRGETPAQLVGALRARAALMEREAAALPQGEATLYRALLAHDVGERYATQAGLAPGSWAASQLEAVRAKGEADQATYESGKLVASVVLAMAPGTLGLGALTAAGTTAALQAPGVLAAYAEVHRAAATASAGTGPVDAEAQALRAARVKLGTAAFSVAAAGAGSLGLERLAHARGLTPGAGIAGDAAVAAVAETISSAVEEAARARATPGDRNAVQRAREGGSP